jgi:hypothetical protein
MKLEAIRAALREQYRPAKDTTYWVEAELLLTTDEGRQQEYLNRSQRRYDSGTPLRIDVKKYVPEIPDLSEQYKAELLQRFPTMVFKQTDEFITGKVIRGKVTLTAQIRTHSTDVDLDADGGIISNYGGGQSVQEAVVALKASLDQTLEEAHLIREVL